MTSDTMKAWRLPQFGIGNLGLDRVKRPRPGPKDVLVRTKAVSLNYRDKLVVEGGLLPAQPKMPFIPVSDFCGVVAETGDDVASFSVGDRVMGNFWTEWIDGPPPHSMLQHGASLGGPLPGALSEYIVIPESVAVAAPSNLTDEEASTLPIAALTGWFALTETARVGAGQFVLVQGTGGVSLAGMQIAAALGARVIVLSRSTAKIEKTLELGAHDGIDTSTAADWPRRVMELTDGHGVDHILEVIGGSNLSRSLEAIAAQGQISLIGFLEGMDARISAVPFMLRRARLQGVSVGHRHAFERLVRFIEGKEIHPVIDTVFSFEDARRAFNEINEGPFGKIVIQIDAKQ
ncbi:NAD(P)-dependent alcohol dehydrogenase [Kaustia mangrovi]|uniref:NAD(P)-dependent alcohol dehydrogenase n=1 Tax=Kaustia mangrovi TaxID=2593653 RepID=A0A7S8C3P9_9HYPH|nr:NAD(P)-dependent alcohol dehydrogenase [Kaustia mangrovi]QPC42783.1 NAD(P)-dependent alcohol dehydrogenase [Kaustia mangrovi]